MNNVPVYLYSSIVAVYQSLELKFTVILFLNRNLLTIINLSIVYDALTESSTRMRNKEVYVKSRRTLVQALGESCCDTGKMKPLFLLVLAVVVSGVLSRSTGPPLSGSTRVRICDQMLPNHGGTSARQGNGGYAITTNIPRSVSSGYSYTAGQTYTGRSQII